MSDQRSTPRPVTRTFRTINRRRFLVTASQVTGLIILPSVRTALGFPANERLRLAVVGMAGYGAWHGFAACSATSRHSSLEKP